VLVCERGTMFGYSDLVVDPRNFVLMRDAGCPVTADVTHALQQPAGGDPGQAIKAPYMLP
jgi:2-dehydro-3-deoxyphosphooctonate aldolase (KDO 8-P synthase)